MMGKCTTFIRIVVHCIIKVGTYFDDTTLCALQALQCTLQAVQQTVKQPC